MAGCQWIDRGRVSTNLCIEISLLKLFFRFWGGEWEYNEAMSWMDR